MDLSQPAHLAFILDGNRRWAKSNKLPSLMGHKRGYERAKDLVDAFIKHNIKYVSYFLFSSENWNRSAEEITYLMDLFRDFFKNSISYFHEKNVRVISIGNLKKLPQDLQEKIQKIEDETRNNDGLTLIAAISYSGKDEIVRATRKIAEKVASGKIKIDDIDENLFSSYLDTASIPYPDILIRTSEKRISNFLLWQCAYSEIFFIDKYWPDFSEEDLEKVLDEFSKRNRRYGR
ncbi:MAG: di-trans,poly-cis-decaprenylcistransferase [Alphaproteobacteria bacterium]|nr:di-trans,poly-cis-decaprenylcistransferase [Alphaproteobacteria bacterium]